MVRLKKVLDNENTRLEYTMQCFDYGYRQAADDEKAGKLADVDDYSTYIAHRARECSHVVPHWADLTDTITAVAAGELYADGFAAGYTEYVRDLTAVHKQMSLYSTDAAKLFVDPWTNTWGCVVVQHRGSLQVESEVTTGFATIEDAFAYAQKLHATGDF